MLPELQCLSQPLELQGNSNTESEQYVRVIFESCDPAWYTEGSCKTKSEINEWVKDKEIVILYNEEKFDALKTENPITKLARLTRFKLFRNAQIEYPVRVQFQNVIYSDNLLSVGRLWLESQDIFTMNKDRLTPSTYTDDAADAISGSIVIRLDPDQMMVRRVLDNTFDFFGDIGGLYGTLNGFAFSFSFLMNYNGVYHLLTSRLFKSHTGIAKAQAKKRKPVLRKAMSSILADKLGSKIDKDFDKVANISEFSKVNQTFFTTLKLNCK